MEFVKGIKGKSCCGIYYGFCASLFVREFVKEINWIINWHLCSGFKRVYTVEFIWENFCKNILELTVFILESVKGD